LTYGCCRPPGRAQRSVGWEIHASGGGQVVHHDGDLNRTGDAAEVMGCLCQRQRLVVRRDGHDDVGADGLGMPGQRDRRGGARGAGLSNDGYAVRCLVDDGLDDEPALLAAEGAELSGGTAGDDTMDAAVDGAVDERAQARFIDAAVVGERSGQCDEHAAER
jgi:hypothetical protein